MFSDKLWSRLRQKFKHKDQKTAVVLARKHHELSRSQISKNALKVLYRLHKAGYAAFLVGGGVRDTLLQLAPKDFDIATDARPSQIQQLFRNSRVIGRRFKIVHIYFTHEIIEVSTFRANTEDNTELLTATDSDEAAVPVMLGDDNTYGTIEEDAWRRDFTVNALYYNIEDFSVIDYTGGMLDLQRRRIRMIGDPVQRYHEDPVRLLRAIRLAAKLNFNIESQTEAPLYELGHLLYHVPPSRLLDEFLKLFFKGHAEVTLKRLQEYGYIKVLFPKTVEALKQQSKEQYNKLIHLACLATDQRLANNLSVNPGFLFAVLLWPAYMQAIDVEKDKHAHHYQAIHAALEQVLNNQVNIIMIPRRFTTMIRAIWLMQYHLIFQRRKRIWRTFNHRYFRAAYDFLELRAKAGESHVQAVAWWHDFQFAKTPKRHDMIDQLQ